jgi:hypothetical protein
MKATLSVAGIVFVGAALIGGGLKGFGVEVPLIQSIRRQVLFGLAGVVFLCLALVIPESGGSRNLTPTGDVPTPLDRTPRKVAVTAKAHCVRPNEYEAMLNTRVRLLAGQRVRITATGTWNAARYDEHKERESGPDGLDPKRWGPGAIVNFGQQRIAVGSLVGKIGQGRVFLVGSEVLLRAEDDGELLLGFADNGCDDNAGSIDVTIAPE